LANGDLRPFWRFLLCLPVFIVAEIVAVQISFLFVRYADDSLAFESLYRPLHLILLLAAFSVISRAVDHFHGNPLAYQGLNFNGLSLGDALRGWLLGIVLVSLAVAVIAIGGQFSASLLPGPHLKAAVLCLWVLATAAMLEEVVFRGYPFQRLVESIGALPATLAFAFLFAFVHLRNPHATVLGAVNTALVGILFSLAYLKTKSLWLPFGIHFGWNLAMGLLYGLPVSGITMFSVIIHGQAIGPEWLTGSAYGIEAALSGTFAILMGMLALHLWRRDDSSASADATPIERSSI
jgi:membrane protease YdiL (CAAX protease family)